MIVDHLAHYAESHIDDVEFYIQQIMHLIVNMDSAKTDKLVNLLLSICKAKVYVEHLGNSIHLALQLFWLLEAKIQDKDPNTYNLCAKLLMSIEAKIVNQHFEPAVGCVSQLLMDMPGLKQRVLALESPRKRKENQSSMSSPTRSASLNFPPPSPSPASVSSSSETRNVYVSEGKEYGPAVIRRYGNQNHKGLSIETDMKAADAADPASYLPSDVGEVDQNDGDDEEEELPPAKQRQILLQWMEKERQKRYKYFHQQRDFVNALTDISEKMRLIEPPSARKNHLPAALEALKIPEMAYIPLGRVSDPFCRITRVLKDEGTVFSTHSRAPCLLCFEVIEDQSNAAGKRTNSPSVAKRPVSPRRLSRSSCAGSSSTLITDETEIANYISKLSINGTYLSIEKDGKEDEEEDDQDDEIVDMAELERHLSEETKTSLDEATSSLNKSNVAISPSRHGDPTQTVSRSSSGSISSEISLGSSPISTTIPASGTTGDSTTGNLRRRSKNTYELGLSKLMAESGVFGESWKEKKERIRKASPYGALCGWNVISLISKSNDDIRQEVFAMQLITKFQDIFATNGLPLWLRPYRIISTGKSSGLIETITDAQSLDGLKKTADYQSLRVHFERTYGPDVHAKPFKTAQRNFLNSLVAYSLVCYLLQIKDRHNGNILIDSDGHLVHIDFGFMLGIAPGGQWSFETAPFKLTKEMVQVLGGVGCPLFGEFVQLFSLGMLVAQRNADKIITLVEIMMRNSTFPCFQGRDVSKELQKLKERFHLNLNKEQLVKHVIKMISTSYKNKWTKRYDQFQKLTNGIIP
jgi:phosphatidylinositol 4-kinase